MSIPDAVAAKDIPLMPLPLGTMVRLASGLAAREVVWLGHQRVGEGLKYELRGLWGTYWNREDLQIVEQPPAPERRREVTPTLPLKRQQHYGMACDLLRVAGDPNTPARESSHLLALAAVHAKLAMVESNVVQLAFMDFKTRQRLDLSPARIERGKMITTPGAVRRFAIETGPERGSCPVAIDHGLGSLDIQVSFYCREIDCCEEEYLVLIIKDSKNQVTVNPGYFNFDGAEVVWIPLHVGHSVRWLVYG